MRARAWRTIDHELALPRTDDPDVRPAGAFSMRGHSVGGFGSVTTNKIIAGVCGGIENWLGWSPTWVRILYVVISVLSVAFPGILVYIILWIVMPKAS